MVKVLKLVGESEEIVADATYHNETSKWDLKNPMRVVTTPQGIGLIPLSIFMKETVVQIRHDHVVYVGTVEDEMASEYNQQFGGIVKADAGTLKLVH